MFFGGCMVSISRFDTAMPSAAADRDAAARGVEAVRRVLGNSLWLTQSIADGSTWAPPLEGARCFWAPGWSQSCATIQTQHIQQDNEPAHHHGHTSRPCCQQSAAAPRRKNKQHLDRAATKAKTEINAIIVFHGPPCTHGRPAKISR